MANSGYKKIQATSSHQLIFSWSVNKQSINDNYSIINWKMTLKSGTYGAIGGGSSPVYKDWKVTVNGNSYSGRTTIRIGANSSKTLASGSTKIPHNTDGEKTFSYSFSQEFNINFNGHVGTVSGSGSGSLPDIPRASTLTVPSIYLGSTGTLTIKRASSKFTHTISVEFGSNSMTIASKTSATSIKFTPPLEWSKSVINSASAKAHYKISTYNGSKFIGSKTVSGTLTVPKNIVPSIDSVTHAEAEPGVAANIGFYAKTKSKIKFNIGASGNLGSKITLITTEIDGQTLKGYTPTTNYIQSCGEIPVKITAKDSRGRTTSKSLTIDVLDYYVPKIVFFNVFRCEQNGSPKVNGEYVTIVFSAKFAELNQKNKPDLKIYYRQAGTDQWNELYSFSEFAIETMITTTTIFSTDYAWDFKIVAEDYFNNNEWIVAYANVPTGSPIMDFNKSGKGLAIGKVSEKNAMEIATPVEFVGENDTGWISPTLIDFKPYAENSVPRIRKRVGIVYLEGSVSPLAAGKIEVSNKKKIFELPTEFQPENIKIFVCNGSGRASWTLRVEGNLVYAERYRDDTGYATATTTAWMPFCVSYLL